MSEQVSEVQVQRTARLLLQHDRCVPVIGSFLTILNLSGLLPVALALSHYGLSIGFRDIFALHRSWAYIMNFESIRHGNAILIIFRRRWYDIRMLLVASFHRYTSSKGLVSGKQLSQTSLTTLAAWTSSLHSGRPATDIAARLLTHSWNCCVTFHWPLVKNSRSHLHSPLRVEALISLQAACRRLPSH